MNIKQVDLFNFVGLMSQEMEANEKKGSLEEWIEKDPRTLLFDMLYHAAKLSAAIRDDNAEKVKEFAADCANLAMMTMLAHQHQSGKKAEAKKSDSIPSDSEFRQRVSGSDSEWFQWQEERHRMDSDEMTRREAERELLEGRYAHGATQSS